MGTGGRAWRPVIHVEDLARVYTAVLAAPDTRIHNEIFNVVAPNENYRVVDLADTVTEYVPDCTRTAAPAALDEPSFRVDGRKLTRTFPDFVFRWTLPLGIRQLRTAMISAGVTPGDWRSDRYRRLLRLSTLLEHGELDSDLRRCEVQPNPVRVSA